MHPHDQVLRGNGHRPAESHTFAIAPLRAMRLFRTGHFSARRCGTQPITPAGGEQSTQFALPFRKRPDPTPPRRQTATTQIGKPLHVEARPLIAGRGRDDEELVVTAPGDVDVDLISAMLVAGPANGRDIGARHELGDCGDLVVSGVHGHLEPWRIGARPTEEPDPPPSTSTMSTLPRIGRT